MRVNNKKDDISRCDLLISPFINSFCSITYITRATVPSTPSQIPFPLSHLVAYQQYVCPPHQPGVCFVPDKQLASRVVVRDLRPMCPGCW